MMPMMKVGFVGVGVMGAPIARNILKGGFPLAVYDVDGGATDRLVAAGASRAASPAAATAVSDVVITMVPDAPDVEQAALGPDGILAGAHPGLIYVDMSTIDPVTTRRVGAAMAARGVRMIDCPVGRTTAHAEAGRLLLMLGGDPQDIETVRPILACTADTFIYCGPLGNGSATKVVNNYLGMSIAAAAAETLALGVRAGLSVEHMLDVFRATMAANAQVDQVMRAKALADDFTPGFMVRLGHKDLRLALDRYDVPLAAAALQFPLAHVAVASVVAGARSAAEVEANVRLLRHSIPRGFWEELRAEGLLPAAAPVP